MRILKSKYNIVEVSTVDCRYRRSAPSRVRLQPPRKKNPCWGIQTRAFPTGVTAFRSNQLYMNFVFTISAYIYNYAYFLLQKSLIVSQKSIGSHKELG